LYTEQPDRGSRSGRSKGNTHEDCIHSRRQVGEFSARTVPTKTETGRSSAAKDRARERDDVGKGERRIDMTREHHRGREKKGETQTGTFV